jgi:hypothetical protein
LYLEQPGNPARKTAKEENGNKKAFSDKSGWQTGEARSRVARFFSVILTKTGEKYNK